MKEQSRHIGKIAAGLAALAIVEATGTVITDNAMWPLTMVGINQRSPETSQIGWEHKSPQGHMNDFASLLTNEDKTTIETQLAKLKDETSAEVAVVTVENLNGDYIENYAVKLFEDWKIGETYQDNGVLFLIVKEGNRVRIEVGYGLEPDITDGRAGRILDQARPHFEKGDYANGIKTGVDGIEEYIRQSK